MKNIFLNYSMKLIKNENKYDETKLAEIKYGLEAIYLNVSRFTVYFIINAILGVFVQGLVFLLFYIPLRGFSYGFHAKNSLTCWIISGIAFVGLPYISMLVTFDLITKIIIILYVSIIFILYSPSDTPSRPIVNKSVRLKLKIFTLIVVFIYSSLIFLLDNQFINLIVLILIYQSIMISPFFYKIFNLQYNNYLYYGLN